MESIVKIEPIDFDYNTDTCLPSGQHSFEKEDIKIKNEAYEEYSDNMSLFEHAGHISNTSINEDIKIKIEAKDLESTTTNLFMKNDEKRTKNNNENENLSTKNLYLRELFKDDIDEFAVITKTTESDNETNEVEIQNFEEIYIKIENDKDEVQSDLLKDETEEEYEIRIVIDNDVKDINQPIENDIQNVSIKAENHEVLEHVNDKSQFSTNNTKKRIKRTLENPSLYVCELCNHTFCNNTLLLKHTKSCGVKCYICNKAFTKELYLRQHIKLSHSKKFVQSFKCYFCLHLFSTKAALQTHINEIHLKMEDQSLKCKFCQKIHNSQYDLKIHINLVHFKKKSDTLDCQYCGKICSSEYYLKVHTKSVHSKKQNQIFKCILCGKQFTNKFLLQTHINKTHPNQTNELLESFKCYFCLQIFSNKTLLRSHINEYHLKIKDQSPKCNYCKKNFYNQHDLKVHIHTIHFKKEDNLFLNVIKDNDDKNAKINCEVCNQIFSKNFEFLEHFKCCHNKRVKQILKCHFCGNGFDNIASLRQHHDENHSEFICPLCQDVFSNDYKLKDHVNLIHSKKADESYKCQFCPKLFPCESYVKKHIKRMHSDEISLE